MVEREFVEGVVGVNICPPQGRVVDVLTKGELNHIRACISDTKRPSWHASPPANLGEAQHGKLKADEWRSLIEFDIPVALAQLCKGGSDRVILYECSMRLGIAIRFATSNRVTQHSIEKFEENFLEFLNLLFKIDPTFKLRPNHHNTMHFGPLLKLFGPMRGWWMYLHERINGMLQNTNTNFRPGTADL